MFRNAFDTHLLCLVRSGCLAHPVMYLLLPKCSQSLPQTVH
jgi:hypothetical protein